MILSLGVVRSMAGVTRDLHPSDSGSGAEESTHPRLGSKGIGGTGAWWCCRRQCDLARLEALTLISRDTGRRARMIVLLRTFFRVSHVHVMSMRS